MTIRLLRSRLAQVVAVLATVVLITTCNDRPPTVSEPEPPERPTTPALAVTPEPVVVVAAGNIARCDRTNDEETARLLDGIPGTVLALGDDVYGGGARGDFDSCYEPGWGRHKARTRPIPGDEEYLTADAAGYFSYFGETAGTPGTGYYSYDLGEWHIVALNSGISTTASSAQVTWLNADLAATTRPCVLAYWHHPRFSSYGTPVRSAVKPLWDALYAAQADVVLNAHYRLYERFALQTPTEAPDPTRGIRQFTIGTGGQGVHAVGTVRPNSEVRASGGYGVLKLTLDATSYSWQFISITGQTFTDAGTTICHGRPGGPPPPNQPPIANHGGPYQSEATVMFNAGASRDPDNNVPLAYAWDFGGGATATGVSPSRTYDAPGVYPVSLVVTDALGLPSTSVSTTVTIGNLPPVVASGADATVNHGAPFELTGTFSDPGGAGDAPWSWTIAWGDGASEDGAATSLGSPISRTHTYSALGTYTVRLTVTDKDGGAGTDELSVTVVDPNAEAVLVGAGDIASCWQNRDEMTAALIDNIPGTVILLGDNAYGEGTPEEYANCYHPTWGRHKARTKPAPGNHEYGSNGAPGYFGYFGAIAGEPTKGWYSYDAGAWHIIVLNSGKQDFYEAAPGSPQNAWLRADLTANTKLCTLAYWHHPMFTSSSGRTTNNDVRPFWDLLYEFGVDVILNGHDHSYERFAPMRPDGTLDPQFGILSITAGTGGESLYSFGPFHPHSVVQNNVAHGVIKMTLRPGTYEWEFIPIPGQTFSDRGTGTCHAAPSGGPPPNQAPTANPGGPYQADNTVVFNGSASDDPDGNYPLTYAWNFGDGTTGSGVSPTKSYAADQTYTVTLTVTDAFDTPSATATTSVTIANVAPTVNAGADATVDLGSAFTLNATFSDPGGSLDAPWTWSIAWGDGSPGENGSTPNHGGPISRGHTYATGGQYTVSVTVTDKDGGSHTDVAVVTVTAPAPNQPPVAHPGGPYRADNTIVFDGSQSDDPDNHLPLTYAWEFGDGATGSGVSPTRTYLSDGVYTVGLVVADARDLSSARVTTTATIENVAPSVNGGTDATVQQGSVFTVNATFTDPGGPIDAPWAWSIDWGDGTPVASGSTSTYGGPVTASHGYAGAGSYVVRVTVTDKDGGMGEDDVLVTVSQPGTSFVLAGAGNIARCDGSNDEATALLLDDIGGTVFTTGDNIHATGTLGDYQACYGSATTGWGRHKTRTRPAAGDDDYKVAGAEGYFSYFGAAAGDPSQGYYSYDLGTWHIVVLNSNIGMTASSAQLTWLTADLAQTQQPCVLAYWHHPRFSSYGTTVRSEVEPLWNALYAARADVVVNAHYRFYERFAPQTPTEEPDPALGIRQFIVGTGGHGTHTPGAARPNSEVRASGVYGVLKLTLGPTSYRWDFVPVAGQTFTDTGTRECH